MADLISLSKYKSYNTVTSDTDNAKLALLISGVSALIEAHCGRAFLSKEYTEWHDAYDTKIILEQDPVTAVASVKVSVNGGVDQTTLVEGTDYFVDLPTGTVYSANKNYYFLSAYDTPFKSIEIAYTAGFDVMPKEVELVTVDLVDYYRNNEHKPAQVLGGSSTDNPLPYIGNRFPAHIQRVLDLYRFTI